MSEADGLTKVLYENLPSQWCERLAERILASPWGQQHDRLSSDNAALRERVEALEAFESVSVALQSLVAELEAERDRLLSLLRRVQPHIGDEYMRSWPDDDKFDAMVAEVRAALAAHEPQEPS